MTELVSAPIDPYSCGPFISTLSSQIAMGHESYVINELQDMMTCPDSPEL